MDYNKITYLYQFLLISYTTQTFGKALLRKKISIVNEINERTNQSVLSRFEKSLIPAKNMRLIDDNMCFDITQRIKNMENEDNSDEDLYKKNTVYSTLHDALFV